MRKRIFAWTVEAALASGIMAVAIAQGQHQNAAEIESGGKQWLALMNKDNDNTVDRKEFLDYMSAEFTKADRDHDGTLDVRELGQLRMELAIPQGQRRNTAEIESGGKQWLALMNKDNDNTVDMKEFLDYMSAEFAKADRDHDGTLDVYELGQLRMELSYRR